MSEPREIVAEVIKVNEPAQSGGRARTVRDVERQRDRERETGNAIK